MYRTRVQVKTSQTREVPIYKWEYDSKLSKEVATDEILRVEEVTYSRVLFCGSDDAFEIWKKSHYLPPTAEIKKYRKQNDLPA